MIYTWEGSGYQEGQVISIPKLFVYRGHRGGRWGRGGIANTPDWQWWNVSRASRLNAEDLDQDGAMDVVLYNEVLGGSRPLSVLYGRTDGTLPDTLRDLQQIELSPYGGRVVVFSDVTGDGIAELNILNTDDDMVRIYLGCTGQRLLEQFGTGNDPPEGERWWGKPWAALKGPNHVSSAWLGLERQMFDLGSADTNATEEIWVVSVPSVLCYEVSGWVSDGVHYGLDSIFDGEIAMRVSDARRLGDIDGSGRSSFALVSSDGVHFYRMAESVRLPTPTFWRVPECDTSLSVVPAQGAVQDVLGVEVLPNPSSGEVRVRWRSGEQRSSGEVRITVHDVLGQEVRSFTVWAAQGEAVWDASSAAGGFGGTYFITVTVGEMSQTREVVIRP